MNAELEHAESEHWQSLLVVVSPGSIEPTMADSESVILRVRPWQESSFTLNITLRPGYEFPTRQ
jgi:hypothetical protein